MRAAQVALGVLLVLAGCSGFVDTTSTPGGNATPATATPTDVPAASSAETPSPTPAATPTPTPTPSVTSVRSLSADNPWNQRVVPVAINDTVEDGRNATAIVERALDYWNAQMSRYTDYAFRFRLTDDSSAARVEVRFVADIGRCDGPTNHAAGCARYIEDGEEARDREVARVVSNRSNSLVTWATKHELGHLLGLDHDDEPRFLMAQNSTTPVPNATERTSPWFADALSVAVEYDHLDGDRATVDDQVSHAVGFYEDGANGTVPTDVTFRRTDQHHAADVLVTNDPSTCNVSDGSQVSIKGQNTDGDPAMEAYTRAVVCVDVDDEAVGWHVGYWLGKAFGRSDAELATSFRDAGYQERRSEWWE